MVGGHHLPSALMLDQVAMGVILEAAAVAAEQHQALADQVALAEQVAQDTQ